MTCADDEVAERLQRAGLEIIEDHRTENVPQPAVAWGTIVAVQPRPTVTVPADHPDQAAEVDVQWHRLATEYRILGEDGVFLFHTDRGGDGCAYHRYAPGGRWTPVRLGPGWRLAGVLGGLPDRLEFVALSTDGDALLAVTAEAGNVHLIALDRVAERRTAAGEDAVRETPEEAKAAWASMFDGLRPPPPVEQWADGLAWNEATPDDVLIALIGHTHNLGYRKLPDTVVDAVIRHPEWKVRTLLLDGGGWYTPEQWSRLILAEENPKRRSILASFTLDHRVDLPESTCERLATDPSAQVRGMAACLRRLPARLARALAADPEAAVRASVVRQWQQLDEPTRRHLLADPDDAVRDEALRHHGAGELTRSGYGSAGFGKDTLSSARLEPAFAAHLAHHGEAAERRVLADNPHLPPDLVAHLARDPEAAVRDAVALRPDLTEEQRAAIDFHFDLRTRSHALPWVRKLHDDPDAMRRLAASAHPEVRRSVARAKRLPPDVAERLARDEDRIVRLFLTESCDDAPGDMLLEVYGWWSGSLSFPGRPRNHPNFPRRGLLRFADDPDPRMRLLALDDPDSTAELVERFARDPDDEVRVRAAEDPRLSVQTAIRLLDDPGDSVRTAAARHTGLPVRVLVRLLWERDTAAQIARRPSLPADVMRQMARHVTG